jgi:hypothetical protein
LKSTALLIDGGHLRAIARADNKPFRDPDFIYSVAVSCLIPGKEEIYRVLYYDCRPYVGRQRQPISGEYKTWENGESE